MAKPLHICTPLLESVPMTKVAGCKVFIKCDNMQPTASFKIRGIGHRIQKAVQMGGKHIICSSGKRTGILATLPKVIAKLSKSFQLTEMFGLKFVERGGNAGFAAAYAARQLGYPATIVIPESTPDFVAASLRDEGADVIVHGKVWDHANEYALKLAEDIDGSIMIHPFDHPDTWEGHASVITESANQLPAQPDAVFVCVGGGGLLCGVVQGMKRVGWDEVPIVAMETKGADSYNAAVLAGELVTLPDITSKAKCLGALTVCRQSLDYYKEHPIHSVVVDDREAAYGCLQLADDHRILVQLACGAALAGIYSNVLGDLQKQGKLPPELKSVLVIVCGGHGVALQKLAEYKTSFGL